MRFEADGDVVYYGPSLAAWTPDYWETHVVCLSPGQAYAMAYLLNGGVSE